MYSIEKSFFSSPSSYAWAYSQYRYSLNIDFFLLFVNLDANGIMPGYCLNVIITKINDNYPGSS